MAGNVKLILGLVWMLIQKYHIMTDDARRSMLDWVQVLVPTANVKNFTTDWNDGRTLSGLVDICIPGSISDWNILDSNNAVDNITTAMQVKYLEI